VGAERAAQAAATGAGRVATACPFCAVMLDDGMKESGREDIAVEDISIHLLRALEAGAGGGGGEESGTSG